MIYTDVNLEDDNDIIEHYGVKRRSGRYPYGSGDDRKSSGKGTFLSLDDEMKRKGMGEKERSEALGLSINQYRATRSYESAMQKLQDVKSAKTMYEDGKSFAEISQRLGVSDLTARKYVAQDLESDKLRGNKLQNIKDAVEEGVKKTGYLDVGAGINQQLGISKDDLKNTVNKLVNDEGYFVHEVYVKRLTGDTGDWTTVKVLTKEPDIDVVKKHKADISTIDARMSEDGVHTKKFHKPIPLDMNRIGINFDEDGGSDRDGLLQIRPGAEGLDLGKSHYAQVRIALDGGLYAKGLAVVDPNVKFPKGVDVMFNTNKPKIDAVSGEPTSKSQVFKKIKMDDDDPMKMFGSSITDQRGLLNIVQAEGAWRDWDGSKFPSQFLSKQPIGLVKERLKATFDKVNEHYDEAMKISNPVLREALLKDIASDAESKQQHLKVLGLPRTKAQVLFPDPKLKENEIYAPNFNDGERVALVRYPHAGKFEIPELTVNNKVKSSRDMIGSNALDAVVIHPKVAAKLSGADFDGDVAYVIPNNSKKVKSMASLKGLEDFDPNSFYVGHDTITPKAKQMEMGKVSNLITDMTIKGATTDELARAVKHSMVVIDSEKHQLDYKASEAQFAIPALRKKYQSHDTVGGITQKLIKLDGTVETVVTQQKKSPQAGASTLISRADSKVATVKREYLDKNGKKKVAIDEEAPLLNRVKDLSKISSGTQVESAYGDYINGLRGVNEKALTSLEKLPPFKRVPAQSKKYASEVASLKEKVRLAEANAPRERQAQILAEQLYRKSYDKDMSDDARRRLAAQSLAQAREATGASRKTVEVTPKEWEAIDNLAISKDQLEKIIRYGSVEQLVKLAKPKTTVSPAKINKAQMLLDKGYTWAQIAESVGMSATAIQDALYNKE